MSHKFQDDLVVFGNFGDDTLVVKIHLIVEPDIGHKRQSEAKRNACRDAMTLQIIDEQQTVVVGNAVAVIGHIVVTACERHLFEDTAQRQVIASQPSESVETKT